MSAWSCPSLGHLCAWDFSREDHWGMEPADMLRGFGVGDDPDHQRCLTGQDLMADARIVSAITRLERRPPKRPQARCVGQPARHGEREVAVAGPVPGGHAARKMGEVREAREVRLGQAAVARIEQADAELVQPSIISYKPLQTID